MKHPPFVCISYLKPPFDEETRERVLRQPVQSKLCGAFSKKLFFMPIYQFMIETNKAITPKGLLMNPFADWENSLYS
jgi:hypothetical protein